MKSQLKSQQVPLADVISGQKKTDLLENQSKRLESPLVISEQKKTGLLEVLSKAQNRRHEQVARVWSVFKHIIGKRGPRD